MKDSSANAVYSAENKVFEGENLLSETRLKQFFCHMVGDPWFKNKYGEGYRMYTIGDFFDHSFAYKKSIYILEYQHFTVSSLCHELSHSCKQVRSNPHGKAWQKRYVGMVGKYICSEKAEELAEEFSKIA